MYTLKVVNSSKVFANDKYHLEVAFDLVDGKKVERRILGFPLDKPEAEIKAELQKYVDLYNAEAARAVEQKKQAKVQKQADKTIKGLEGLTL